MARIDATKHAVRAIKRVSMNGIQFTLRDLSQFEIDEAILSAYADFQENREPEHLLDDDKSIIFDLVVKLHIVSRSINIDPDILRNNLPAAGVAILFSKFKQLHESALPDSQEIKRQIMVDFSDKTTMRAELIRAKMANNLFEYYGEPVSRLTDGQIVYYNLLCNLYDSLIAEKEGQNRVVSKKWLEGKCN